MQDGQKELKPGGLASKGEKSTAVQLLVKAMTEKNVSFNFVGSRYFKAFVQYVSKGRFEAPSRYKVVQQLDFG